ncbi:MAG: glycosyltransferase [Gallionella sp.]|nr:glycosyltransferase [Gallionella sp.]
MRNLGHQVVFFESFNRNAYRDFADLNRNFLEKVRAEKPDIILCVLLGYEIWLETFQLVREGTNAILINWSTDDSWKYRQFSRFVASAFHLYATTYPDALAKSKQDGYDNFVLTQWAANSANLAEPLPAAQCRYPVSFIGTAYGNRPKWISALDEWGIKVECFGHGWENGSVPAGDIPKIMRDSIISLNFGDSGMVMRGIVPGRSRQIKARAFEVPGAGGFLMTEYADGLDRFYRSGDEIAVFDGILDLDEKIRHFIGRPEERDRIAMAGYIRTRDEHTYEMRFGNLLDAAMQQKERLPDERREIDFEKYDTIEKKHRAGVLLKIFKRLLLLPCMMIWGNTRGSRAARRFLFELSWRLAGKNTYTVSGWPGRLFYKES